EQQLLLAREVAIDGADGNPGALGDLLDLSLQPFAGEDVGGSLDDALTVRAGVGAQFGARLHGSFPLRSAVMSAGVWRSSGPAPPGPASRVLPPPAGHYSDAPKRRQAHSTSSVLRRRRPHRCATRHTHQQAPLWRASPPL